MCIFSLLFLFSIAAFAQNTKGDKPVSNQRQVRESKGKARAQKGNKKPKTKDIAGRRLRTKDKSSANRANVGIPQPDPYRGRKKTKSDRAAKPQGRIFNTPPSEKKQRAWTGDLSGSPIRRIKPSKSGVARNNVYPQRGPYVYNGSKKPKKDKPKVYTRTASGEFPKVRTPQNNQRAWKGNIRGGSVGTPSRTGQTKNTFKQFGAFGSHPSRKPRSSERIQSGKIGVARFFGASSSPWPRYKKNVKPRSASQSFLSRGKKNVYWGKYKKSGRPVTTDITGGSLRTRNFRSIPAGLVSRDTLRTFGRRPGGDRASKQSGGGFLSTRKGQRAWTGDISGKRLRKIKPRTTDTAGEFIFPRKLSMSSTGEVGQPLPSGGISSRSRKRGRVETTSLPSRPPGIGGTSVGKYLGSLKGRRTIKGGGSVSGKRWNNNGEPIDVNGAGSGTVRASKFQGNFKRGELSPGFYPQGEGFAGNKKTRRPPKGGGSVSGKLWNNKGQPVDVNGAGSGTIRASKFQGNVKTIKPEKGGGSISGKQWNNKGQPIGVNGAGIGTIRASKFQGNAKAIKPEKGGGSISGKMWNNNGQPVGVNGAGIGTIRASKFQGNVKAIKPEKGGGSISGKMWNNNEQPVGVNGAGIGTIRASKFQGNAKTRKPEKGGGSVSGKMWNNNEQPIDVNGAGSGTIRASKFQGNVKIRKPEKGGGSVSGKMWNNNEQPIDVNGAGSGTIRASKFQGRTKEGNLLKRGYVQNPNASKESIKKLRPDETTYKVDGLQVKVKAREYKDNPNSADDALKGFYPGKAIARLGDYQGNIKMHKYKDSRLHPDSKFAHGFRDNVKEERTFLMNAKLFWSKLFKKSETQPDHLKEKIRKPRYDKGEEGMWYN